MVHLLCEYKFSFFTGKIEKLSAKTSYKYSDLKSTVLETLSRHPYWQKLLHYYHPGESIGQWSSLSDDISPNFFLHPQGNTDPELELQATLQAILEPVGEDPNQHVRFHFISLKA